MEQQMVQVADDNAMHGFRMTGDALKKVMSHSGHQNSVSFSNGKAVRATFGFVKKQGC
jgi:hypothetical protein